MKSNQPKSVKPSSAAKPITPNRVVAKTTLQQKSRDLAKTSVSRQQPRPSSAIQHKTTSAKGIPKNYQPKQMSNQQVGAKAEKIARSFLKKEGFKVVPGQHNKIHGIDIIAFKNNQPVFTEVKGARDRVRSFSDMKHQVAPTWIRDRYQKLETSTQKTEKQEQAIKQVRHAFGLDPQAALPKADSKKWKGQGVSVNLANNTVRLYDQHGKTVKETRINKD
ncbi:hypothetical protein OSCT_0927 [Oscillochloris trichoides DG-6]|uniref:Uncharacterized protein n=1 Tax=Oscillochloris trichoides DG-6 TaxID=765420 RepID=E1IC76_9CHLR|nr:YraN family protein [Oscillochloris trichoides]EFO81193.1 hypothetical protein OSCT_0927 [Oscillochloris trichoides DG-6]